MRLPRLRAPAGPRRTYGPRVDADTGGLHMRVPDAIRYERERVTTLWTRRVGNGTLTLELLRGHKPSRRLVQLVADYEDAGNGIIRTCVCEDQLDEARQIARLEKLMLEASIRPMLDAARDHDAAGSAAQLEPGPLPASSQDE
jgi:hypothetical protein